MFGRARETWVMRWSSQRVGVLSWRIGVAGALIEKIGSWFSRLPTKGAGGRSPRLETGHLVEHKEERNILSKWGNDLRQSYRTLAQAAGVSELDIHLLMNHSLPCVNAGYITRDRLLRDHLRKQQERISDVAVGGVGKKNGSLVSGWLGSTKVDDS